MKTNASFHFSAIIQCLKTRRLFWALPILVGVLLAAMPMAARRAGASAVQQGRNAFWETVEPAAHEARGKAAAAQGARVFRLREQAMRAALQQAGPERAERSEQPTAVIVLPLPDGSFARFRIVEAPVLSAELAVQYPELKSYRGQGVDNPGLAVWCSWTPLGLRAWVRDGAETLRIQPLTDTTDSFPLDYISLVERVEAEQAQDAVCSAQVKEMAIVHAKRLAPERASNFSVGLTLRTYRLALATTREYTQDPNYGNNNETTTNTKLFEWVNAVNVIYESELAIRFTLVTNTDLIFLSNDPNEPFTNGNANLMADEVRALFKAKLPEGSYDLGMVLGTGSGGTAYVGVVCENASDTFGPYKGGAAALINGAANNANSVKLIAHEIGHQFGAMHTQNADCAGRFGDSAVEPGGGVSLMSNVGSCAGHEVVTERQAFFHATSFRQINQFLGSFVSTDCAVTNATGNSVPMITSKTPNYTIPKETPFTLTATASDANDSTLTYAWEQVDAGAEFFNGPYNDLSDGLNSTRPLFRPFLPMTNIATRTFPSLTYILNNANVPPDMVGNLRTAERLPQVSRTLNFAVTVRDNRANGGGVSNDSVQLTVDGNSGPFQVGAVTGTWTIGTSRTITWTPANTDVWPVSCAYVKITLLNTANNAQYVLAAAALNNGSANLVLPGNVPAIANARVKVEAVGNIFFDISDTDFSVVTPGNCVNTISPTQRLFSVAGGNDTVAVASSGCNWSVINNPGWVTINSGGSGTTSGVVNYTVAANPSTATRMATVTIADQSFTITQAGSNSGYQYFPLPTPVRLLDTRAGQSGCYTPGAPIPGNTSRLQLAQGACTGIPSNAAAITGNITTVQSGGGYLTLYPSNATQPTVSNSNYSANEIVNNVFTVGLGASDGAFNIFVTSNTDVVVDVTGYYAPLGTANGLYFHPLPAPVRLLETRAGLPVGCVKPGTPLTGGQDSQQTATTACTGIPATARAVVGNATTISPQTFGYLTLFPADVARPVVASSNYGTNQAVNGPFSVGLSGAGQFKIFTSGTTDLVVDLLGYYSTEAVDANGAGLLFTPLANPVRLLETRSAPANLPGCFKPNAPLNSGQVYTQPARGLCEGQTIPATALGIVGNATVVFPATLGYLTFWPSTAAQPTVATSNFTEGQVFNRHFTVGLGNTDGVFKMFTSATTHLVVDVSGYFAP